MQLNICEGEGGRAGLRPAWRPHHSVANSLPPQAQLSSSTGEFFLYVYLQTLSRRRW